MDKLSNLPNDIIESILTRMPLKDAVRTSILSKEWRHKWTSIPSLVFTKDCCPASCKGKSAIRAKLTSIINHVLSLHTVSLIQVFKVKVNCCRCCQAGYWLSRLLESCAMGLTALTNRYPDYHDLSSSLYSCTSLTHLNLDNCTLKPLPAPFFDGFKNLKTLRLKLVDLSEDVLQGILRGCPVLENLSVSPINIVPNLRINAPRLRCLDVEGDFHKITFGDTHAELSVVRISFTSSVDKGTESYMAELFSKIPNVETLDIQGYFLQYLSGGLILKRLPTSCYNLRTLTLLADYHNEVLILGALCILRSTPNLTTLTISDMRVEKGQLENMKRECFSCTLNKLTTLVVQPYDLEPEDEDDGDEELHFVRFLLDNSTALQKMTIYIDDDDDDFARNKPNYQPYTQAQIEYVSFGSSCDCRRST